MMMMTSVCQQSPLRAKNSAQTRRALFHLRWPGCLEQSAIIHSRTVQHRHLQTAPQNFIFQTMLFQFFILGRFNSFYLYVTFVTRWSCFYNCKRWTLWTYDSASSYALTALLSVWYIVQNLKCSSQSNKHQYNPCWMNQFNSWPS